MVSTVRHSHIQPFAMRMSGEGEDEVCPLLSQSPPVDENVPELQRLNRCSQTSSRHLRDLHVLSSTFLFVFLAYSAAQNLQSTLNNDEDLGTMSLAILYLSFSVFSFAATPIVRRFGSKNSIIIGTSGFWLFIAANFYPSWYTMVPASIYVGFGAAILWVAAGTRLTCAARSHATECNLPEGTVIGNFNGEFWGMCASCQAIGNLFSLFLLKTGKMKAVLTASISEGGKGCSDPTLLFTVFLSSMTLGTILACFLTKQSSTTVDVTVQHSSASHSSLRNLVKAIIVPLLDIRMLLLIPLFAYSGLQQSFVWAEYTKYVISPALGMSGIGGAMAIYGIADTSCSLIAGRLTTGLFSISLITSGGMLSQGLVLLRLWLKHSFTSGGVGLANMLSIAAIWGVGNGVCNTQISALLGILFPHISEAAFSQFRIWQAGAISAALFLSPHITFVTMLAVLAAGVFVSVGACLVLTLWVEKAARVRS